MEVNIFAGLENLTRCFEIAHSGNFEVFIYPNDSTVTEEYLNAVRYNFKERLAKSESEAHLIYRLCRPEFSEVLTERKEPDFSKVKPCYKRPEIKGEKVKTLLQSAYEKMKLNPDDVFKIIEMAQVIAFMEGEKIVQLNHLAEAIQYRRDKSI